MVQGIGKEKCLLSAIVVDDDTSNDGMSKSRYVPR